MVIAAVARILFRRGCIRSRSNCRGCRVHFLLTRKSKRKWRTLWWAGLIHMVPLTNNKQRYTQQGASPPSTPWMVPFCHGDGNDGAMRGVHILSEKSCWLVRWKWIHCNYLLNNNATENRLKLQIKQGDESACIEKYGWIRDRPFSCKPIFPIFGLLAIKLFWAFETIRIRVSS